MKLKVLLILFLFTSVLTFGQKSKKVFTTKAIKDMAQGSLPFYDMEENYIDILISFKRDVDTTKLKLIYALQEKSNLTNKPDIYLGTFASFPYPQKKVRIPINDTFLKSGNYSIDFRLYDLEEQLVAQEKVTFQTLRKKNNFLRKNKVYTQKTANSSLNIDISKTFVAQYEIERLRTNIKALRPIATPTEAGTIAQLSQETNIEFLQRFFFNYWKEKNPLHPEEEWKAYAEKLNYVAKKFGSGAYQGYKTDRGALYLKYGPPNRMINASNERGANPYEVWFYTNLETHTNISLLFVQISALANDRILIHSSVPGFFYNPNWRQQLFKDPSEADNKLGHKVYEFFKE